MLMRLTILSSLTAVLLTFGCADSSAPPPGPSTPAVGASGGEDAKIEAAINELSEADRALAKAQKFCAVSDKGRLGSMGKPFKIELDGKPVFLCCDGCEGEARKDAEATLAKVEKLKAGNP